MLIRNILSLMAVLFMLSACNESNDEATTEIKPPVAVEVEETAVTTLENTKPADEESEKITALESSIEEKKQEAIQSTEAATQTVVEAIESTENAVISFEEAVSE